MSKKEIKNIICARILDLRKKSGLTSEQLAYQSGISKGGLSEIERNMKEPMQFTIARICAGLGITLKEFYDFAEMDEYVKNL